MFVANIEDDIIRWLQEDEKAAEFALYWSRSEFMDQRSRHLADMIEDKFSGLSIPRNNETKGVSGVYLSVIRDTWEILPKTLHNNLFDKINQVLASESERTRFEACYPEKGHKGRKIDEALRDDYNSKKWLLLVFQMYKNYYDTEVIKSIDLIHYIDISKPVNLNESFNFGAGQQTALPDNFLTRW